MVEPKQIGKAIHFLTPHPTVGLGVLGVKWKKKSGKFQELQKEVPLLQHYNNQ